MVTISTADKFLGSLVGAYIGHYYSDHHHGPWPPTSSSPLYQAWLASIQPPQLPVPNPLDTRWALALPWLLYHHDDSHNRQHGLSQTLASSTIGNISTRASTGPHTTGPADTTGSLYILGDCLEWLMQCSTYAHSPCVQLCEHLRHQCSYPAAIRPQVNQFIEQLATQSTDIVSTPPGQGHPLLTMTLALRGALTYRENMALAFTSPGTIAPILTLVGCLLGAWHGPSVIPMGWLMALTEESRQALAYMAQQLYRRWAGISNLTANIEAFPLDL